MQPTGIRITPFCLPVHTAAVRRAALVHRTAPLVLYLGRHPSFEIFLPTNG